MDPTKGIDETIKQNNIRIEKYENDKIKKNEELKALIKSSTRDNEGQISIINQDKQNQLLSLTEEKKLLENEIKILEEKKKLLD